MEIDKKRMKELVKSYEGHIEQDVNYRDCKPKEHECLIHEFFMEMKNNLKQSDAINQEKFNPKDLPEKLEKEFDNWWNNLDYENKFKIYHLIKK